MCKTFPTFCNFYVSPIQYLSIAKDVILQSYTALFSVLNHIFNTYVWQTPDFQDVLWHLQGLPWDTQSHLLDPWPVSPGEQPALITLAGPDWASHLKRNVEIVSCISFILHNVYYISNFSNKTCSYIPATF